MIISLADGGDNGGVQAPTPRPVQDGKERTPRSQPPPLRSLVPPKPNPPQIDNRPHGFNGSMAGDQQQGGFFQGAPPPNIPQGGNANDLKDGRGNKLPPPPTLAPQFTQIPGNFYGGDSNNHGQGYGWQQDKRDAFGNGQD
ncbi:hypothetical protein Tco_0328478 [Tanacetum coccineum]